MRIVSLLPSATELVCALGATDELVGVSHECDHPVEALGRRVLTSSRMDPSGSSAAIDAAVRQVLDGALSIYAVDAAGLAEVQPDVIVTQDLCEVCAVSLDDVRAAVARLAHKDDVAICSLNPTRFGEVLDDVGRVADAIGRIEEGRQLREALDVRVEAVMAAVASVERRPRVVSIEWLDPLMLGGTWMPELIAMAGGEPLGAGPGEPAPTVSLADLAAMDPDFVLVKPCGFDIRRTLEERDLVARVAECVPDARVRIADGNAYFNRPGPRIVDSLEILAACLHPERFAARRDATVGL